MHPVPNMMNGLPRGCLPSFLNIEMGIVWIFGSFWGHVVNEFLIKILAFLGMYFLLKMHFLKEEKNHIVVAFAALFFALIPTLGFAGLAEYGLPLLILAFLNLRKPDPSLYNYGLIALFAFYSFFVYSGMFALIALGLLGSWDIYANRKVNYRFFSGLAFLLFLYIGIEYQLIDLLFFEKNFHTHRVDFDFNPSLNEKGVVIVSLLNLFTGKYHSGNFPGFIFIPIGLAGLVYGFFQKNVQYKTVLLLFALACLTAFLTTIWDWSRLRILYENISIFRSVNFRRFHYFLPPLVVIFFATGISQFSSTRYFRHFFIVLVLVITGWLWRADQAFNHHLGDYHGFSKSEVGHWNFNQFYTLEPFSEIKDFIGQPQHSYRIACLGFQPAVAQYNGFFTLDSYQNNFPLEYRRKFTAMQAKEFQKSKATLENGNRCYLVSAEVANGEASDFHIKKWEIDTDILQELNCSYIISILQIDNSDELGFSLLKSFEGTHDFPKSYLYFVGKTEIP